MNEYSDDDGIHAELAPTPSSGGFKRRPRRRAGPESVSSAPEIVPDAPSSRTASPVPSADDIVDVSPAQDVEIIASSSESEPEPAQPVKKKRTVKKKKKKRTIVRRIPSRTAPFPRPATPTGTAAVIPRLPRLASQASVASPVPHETVVDFEPLPMLPNAEDDLMHYRLGYEVEAEDDEDDDLTSTTQGFDDVPFRKGLSARFVIVHRAGQPQKRVVKVLSHVQSALGVVRWTKPKFRLGFSPPSPYTPETFLAAVYNDFHNLVRAYLGLRDRYVDEQNRRRLKADARAEAEFQGRAPADLEPQPTFCEKVASVLKPPTVSAPYVVDIANMTSYEVARLERLSAELRVRAMEAAKAAGFQLSDLRNGDQQRQQQHGQIGGKKTKKVAPEGETSLERVKVIDPSPDGRVNDDANEADEGFYDAMEDQFTPMSGRPRNQSVRAARLALENAVGDADPEHLKRWHVHRGFTDAYSGMTVQRLPDRPKEVTEELKRRMLETAEEKETNRERVTELAAVASPSPSSTFQRMSQILLDVPGSARDEHIDSRALLASASASSDSPPLLEDPDEGLVARIRVREVQVRVHPLATLEHMIVWRLQDAFEEWSAVHETQSIHKLYVQWVSVRERADCVRATHELGVPVERYQLRVEQRMRRRKWLQSVELQRARLRNVVSLWTTLKRYRNAVGCQRSPLGVKFCQTSVDLPSMKFVVDATVDEAHDIDVYNGDDDFSWERARILAQQECSILKPFSAAARTTSLSSTLSPDRNSSIDFDRLEPMLVDNFEGITKTADCPESEKRRRSNADLTSMSVECIDAESGRPVSGKSRRVSLDPYTLCATWEPVEQVAIAQLSVYRGHPLALQVLDGVRTVFRVPLAPPVNADHAALSLSLPSAPLSPSLECRSRLVDGAEFSHMVVQNPTTPVDILALLRRDASNTTNADDFTAYWLPMLDEMLALSLSPSSSAPLSPASSLPLSGALLFHTHWNRRYVLGSFGSGLEALRSVSTLDSLTVNGRRGLIRDLIDHCSNTANIAAGTNPTATNPTGPNVPPATVPVGGGTAATHMGGRIGGSADPNLAHSSRSNMFRIFDTGETQMVQPAGTGFYLNRADRALELEAAAEGRERETGAGRGRDGAGDAGGNGDGELDRSFRDRVQDHFRHRTRERSNTVVVNEKGAIRTQHEEGERESGGDTEEVVPLLRVVREAPVPSMKKLFSYVKEWFAPRRPLLPTRRSQGQSLFTSSLWSNGPSGGVARRGTLYLCIQVGRAYNLPARATAGTSLSLSTPASSAVRPGHAILGSLLRRKLRHIRKRERLRSLKLRAAASANPTTGSLSARRPDPQNVVVLNEDDEFFDRVYEDGVGLDDVDLRIGGPEDRQAENGAAHAQSQQRLGLLVDDETDASGRVLLAPFVSLSFAGKCKRTSSRACTYGGGPGGATSGSVDAIWNQTLCVPIHEDMVFAAMHDHSRRYEAVTEPIVFDVFDEVLHPLHSTSGAGSSTATTAEDRLERRWLGRLQIPFRAVIEGGGSIAGVARLQCPLLSLGYCVTPTGGSDMHAGGGRTATSSGSFGGGSGGEAGAQLSFFISLQPLPPGAAEELASRSFGRAVYMRCLPEEEAIFSRVLQWEQSMRRRFDGRRHAAAVAVHPSGSSVLACRYVCAQVPPPRCRTASEVLRFVSLIPYIDDRAAVVASGGTEEYWDTSAGFLQAGAGDWQEHAILLCNYFVNMGWPAWVVCGYTATVGRTAFVLALEGVDAYYLWDPVGGDHYAVSDHRCPLYGIGTVFNATQVWMNVQKYDRAAQIAWDFNSAAKWKPLFAPGALAIPPDAQRTIQPAIGEYELVDEARVAALEKRIFDAVEEAVEKWRGDPQLHEKHVLMTRWNRSANSVLRPLLVNGERALSGRVPFGLDEHDTALQPFRLRYGRLCGAPVNVPFTDVAAVVDAVRGTGVFLSERHDVEFGLGVYVHAYTPKVLSVWVYLIAMFPRL